MTHLLTFALDFVPAKASVGLVRTERVGHLILVHVIKKGTLKTKNISSDTVDQEAWMGQQSGPVLRALFTW